MNPKDTLEKEVERKLTNMVKDRGGLCLKWVCPGWRGVPDRIVILPGGRIVFVETKRPIGGKREKLQEWWAAKLKAFGFHHFWISTPQEVQTFEHFLATWDAERSMSRSDFED